MITHLIAHSNSYHPYGLDEALAGIAQAGYTQVELTAVAGWTEHVAFDDDPDMVRARVADHGLVAVGLAGMADLSSDPGLQVVQRGIEWAAAYGMGGYATSVLGPASGFDGHEALRERIGELAASASDHGVMLALEICGHLLATGDAARSLMQGVESAAVGVRYDTANCEYYAGVRAVDDIPAIAPWLVSVDAKDKLGSRGEWHFPAPGEGHVDWAAVIAVLDQHDYAGPLVVEIEFDGEPWPPIEEVNRAMRSGREYLASLVTS